MTMKKRAGCRFQVTVGIVSSTGAFSDTGRSRRVDMYSHTRRILPLPVGDVSQPFDLTCPAWDLFHLFTQSNCQS